MLYMESGDINFIILALVTLCIKIDIQGQISAIVR